MKSEASGSWSCMSILNSKRTEQMTRHLQDIGSHKMIYQLSNPTFLINFLPTLLNCGVTKLFTKFEPINNFSILGNNFNWVAKVRDLF